MYFWLGGGDSMPVNMSYCRFQNTLEALLECCEALSESASNDAFDELSAEERRAATRLVKLCRDFADDYGEAE